MTMTYPTWPFGPLPECKHLCVNQWFNLQGELFPEGLPFEEGSIDFEWSCTAEGPAAIAPLIGSAQDSATGEVYLWLSDRLLNKHNTPQLCCVGLTPKRLRAQNVEADRTKVAESYDFEDNIEWACTMSLHTLLSGPCSGQTKLMRATKSGEYQPWFAQFTSAKNIIALHNFWVEGSEVVAEDKLIRNIFFEGSMEDIREKFVDLMTYSIRDAILVNEIYSRQAEAMATALPSALRQEAAVIRGNVSLSPSPWFETWLKGCEARYIEESAMLNVLAHRLLRERAREFQAEINDSLKEYAMDRLPPEMRTKKGLGPIMAKYKHPVDLNVYLNPQTKALIEKWSQRYQTRDHKAWSPDHEGLPKWIKKLPALTYESPLVQDLAELVYYGQEVRFEPGQKGRKFCYVDKTSGLLTRVFSPKKGPMTEDNCGSLFAMDFIPLFEQGSITCANPLAQTIVTKAAELSYWTSIRARMFKVLLQMELLALHKEAQNSA